MAQAEILGVAEVASRAKGALLGERVGGGLQAGMGRFGAVTWHNTLDTVPDGPMILVANELLDALPFRQFETRDGAWRERLVGLGSDGGLAFGLSRAVASPALIPPAFAAMADGAVFERAPEREALAAEIAERLVRHGGVALLIDYGHARSGLGDTFQAVRGHAYADPLQAPGMADLTSHVDFEAIAAAARAAGVDVFPVITQGAFLEAIGIGARAEALARGKTREVADGIAADLARLTAPDAMGDLFKVICFASPGLAPPPFIP
jgi:SAM-dependent MidA family methyltransferase